MKHINYIGCSVSCRCFGFYFSYPRDCGGADKDRLIYQIFLVSFELDAAPFSADLFELNARACSYPRDCGGADKDRLIYQIFLVSFELDAAPFSADLFELNARAWCKCVKCLHIANVFVVGLELIDELMLAFANIASAEHKQHTKQNSCEIQVLL